MRKAVPLLALVLVLLLAPAAMGVTYGGEITGFGFTEPSAFQFRIESLSGQITCPAGDTFLGRGNARINGEELFVGKFKGTCTGSSQSIGTIQGRSFGTVGCFQEFVARGQIRTSSGLRFKLPDHTFAILCI